MQKLNSYFTIKLLSFWVTASLFCDKFPSKKDRMPLSIFGKQRIQYYITISLNISLVVSLVNSWLGPKKQGFGQNINCIQIKTLYFVYGNKKWRIIWIFLKFFSLNKINFGADFFIKPILWITSIFKQPLCYLKSCSFLENCQHMDSQNLVISFEYSWCLVMAYRET